MTLFGYAKTTRAIAQKFGPCTFYDDRFSKPSEDASGNLLLPPDAFDPDASDMEIPSPGFPPNHPLIQKARNLISEYDLFADSMPYSIWISGTNGKTTLTQMITHLLSERGAVSGGNIGKPLALMPQSPIWVLETSSFTLHYTRKASPDLYVLLPITPDHLYWHGSFEAYRDAKLKPLRSMREGQAILLPQMYTDEPTQGWKIGYNDASSFAEAFEIEPDRIDIEGIFRFDAILALAVTKILFDEIDYAAINRFTLDAHRQEMIVDHQERRWINDSKATNLDATIQAIRPVEAPMHLILGGDDKGVDLAPLFELLKHKNVTVYAIGSNMKKLARLAHANGVRCIQAESLPYCIEAIDKVHTRESLAILSPAAASLDQFASYIERGETFRRLIKHLASPDQIAEKQTD